MRTLPSVLLLIIGSAVLTRVAAVVVSRQLSEGSEVSDEFRRVVIFNGLEFTSRARGLRSGEVSVVLGGATLDLRGAVIGAAGARVLVENTLGGMSVTVRDDWRVNVTEMLVGGGVIEVQVTPPEELPDDAPALELAVVNRLGSTVISTGSIDL